MARRLDRADVQADTLSTLGLLPNLPYEERQAALFQAVELAESAGLLATAARAHINLGEFLHKAGDLPAARQHYLQARELAKRVGMASWEHGFIGLAADLSLDMGDYARVERAIQAMRDLHSEIPNPGPAAFYTRLIEAHLARVRGEWEKAVPLYQQCRIEAAQRGDQKQLAIVDLNLGETLSETGRDDEAVEVLEDVIRRNEARGLFLQSASPLFILGAAYLRRGDIPRGRQALEKAREYIGANPSPRHQGLKDWGRARLAAAEKRWEDAFAAFDTLVKTTVRLSAPWYQAKGLVEWAQAHLARGEPQDIPRARDLFLEALAIYKRLEIPVYAARVERNLDTLRAGVPQEGI
jgi:tetratricopeptide (TPR) repeat protein